MTTDYVPIECDQHSVLELLAMQRRPVTVAFETPDAGAQKLPVRVLDVYAKQGAEYLLIRGEDGEERTLRLDRVLAIYEASEQIFGRQ